jgi:hypothetical protein
VPDIDKFISSEVLKVKYQRRPVAVSFAAQHYEHRSVWDASLMMEVAAECGFTNIRETEFGCGSDERLVKDQEPPRRKLVCGSPKAKQGGLMIAIRSFREFVATIETCAIEVEAGVRRIILLV